jgi:hypothetical protein
LVPKRASKHVRWLAQVLWNEIFAFFLPFPIEPVPGAGPRDSLHFYIYSEHLFFEAMQLDRKGVPFQRSRALGDFYNPAYVAWYALMALEQSLRKGGNPDRRFETQVEWLLSHAAPSGGGAVFWPFPVDFQEGRGKLRAPWPSAMCQGLVISALVRAHRLNPGDHDLMKSCLKAADLFGREIHEGGVRTSEQGLVLYEEYPVFPLPRVLDGFLFGLLGLYDLWIETGDPLVGKRFDDGVKGLVGMIHTWNYKGRWTWYGTHGYLCPRHYHTLNRLLISALAELTGEERLAGFASAWGLAESNGLGTAGLFPMFFLLKQKSRMRSFLSRVGAL